MKSTCHKSFGAACSKRRQRRGAAGSATISPCRCKIVVTVLGAGADTPARAKTAAILRPPQVGCACRTATTSASSAAAVFVGEAWGRRDRSANPASPAAARPSHLYPVLALIPYRRHNARMLASSWLAKATNS
jgi:hypothetical protein